MSHIDDFVDRLCPEGVPFVPLGEALQNFDSKRRPVTKSDRSGGDYPYYGANGVQDYVDDFIFDGTFLLMGEDGSVKQADGRPVLNWATGKIWVNNHAHVLQSGRDDLDLRFVYFYLQTVDISSLVTGGTQPKLNQRNMNSILLPVPPLEVQREIVRVLDTFTALEAELEAELEARRIQYEHYRTELLTFSGVPMRALGDLARNLDNQRKPVTKDVRAAGGIPYYGASGVVDYVRDFIFDGDYLLVSEDGANLLARSTPIAFSITGKTWVNNHAHVLEFDTYAERRFVEIFLNSIDLSPYISGAAQPKLNKANLNRIPETDPGLGEKERIVALLDKFDALVNDLSTGLPAELAARRKQYEYYRDKLLTFEEASA